MTRRVRIRQSEIRSAILALASAGERGTIEIDPKNQTIRVIVKPEDQQPKPKQRVRL